MSSDQPPFITRSNLFTLVFFTLFLVLAYQLAGLLAPFSSALLWAAILALALNPVYRKLISLMRGRAGLAAAAMTVATMLLVIGPAIGLLAVLAAQAVDLYQWVSGLVQTGKLAEEWARLAGPVLEKLAALPFFSALDVKSSFLKSLGELSSGMASQIGSIMKNTLLFLLNIVIMLIALFFFFRNGESYYRTMTDLFPFPAEHKRMIDRKLRDTFYAVINGIFLIALLQGVMTGIGFALFRVPFPVLWGALAAVLALLPIGGAALVWLPGVLYLYLTGSVVKSVLLLAWGTVLVSLPDNFLKPLLIGRKAKISSFFLFLAILGGLQVYGFLGILFGPLIVTLLSVFIQIYREEYGDR